MVYDNFAIAKLSDLIDLPKSLVHKYLNVDIIVGNYHISLPVYDNFAIAKLSTRIDLSKSLVHIYIIPT